MDGLGGPMIGDHPLCDRTSMASDPLELPLASRHGGAVTCHKMLRARCAEFLFQNGGIGYTASRLQACANMIDTWMQCTVWITS